MRCSVPRRSETPHRSLTGDLSARNKSKPNRAGVWRHDDAEQCGEHAEERAAPPERQRRRRAPLALVLRQERHVIAVRRKICEGDQRGEGSPPLWPGLRGTVAPRGAPTASASDSARALRVGATRERAGETLSIVRQTPLMGSIQACLRVSSLSLVSVAVLAWRAWPSRPPAAAWRRALSSCPRPPYRMTSSPRPSPSAQSAHTCAQLPAPPRPPPPPPPTSQSARETHR